MSQDPNHSADDLTAMMAAYTTQRQALAVARGTASGFTSGSKANTLVGLSRISIYARNLLSNSKTVFSCLADDPSQGWKLSTSLLDIAGGFLPSLMGASVQGLSALLQVSIDFLDKMPVVDAIQESQWTTMPSALNCALEGMTRDYCRARDSSELLNIKEENEKGDLLPIFYGVDLLERKLPALHDWLDRVANGVKPQDGDMATKINLQFARLYRVQSMSRIADGIFGDAAKGLNRAAGDDDRRDVIRKAVRDLIAKDYLYPCAMSSSGGCEDSENPFTGIETPLSMAAKLLGVDPPASTTTISYDQFISSQSPSPDSLPLVQKRAEVILAQRSRQVELEFKEKVNVDTPGLVRMATQPVLNGVNAFQAIEALFRFFDNYAFEPGAFGEQDKLLIEELKFGLGKLHTLLQAPDATSGLTPSPSPSPSALPSGTPMRTAEPVLSNADKIISLCYSLFKLDSKNVFLPGRVAQLVDIDLVNRLNRGEFPKDINDILKVSAIDITDRLREAGVTKFDSQRDLDKAITTTDASLRQFRNLPFVRSALQRTLSDLTNAANYNHEPDFGDKRSRNRNVLADLCIKILVSGMQWPDEVDKSLCQGAWVRSEVADLTLRFDDLERTLSGKSFDDRVCAFEDFLRADRIASLKIPKNGRWNTLGFWPEPDLRQISQDWLDRRFR